MTSWLPGRPPAWQARRSRQGQQAGVPGQTLAEVIVGKNPLGALLAQHRRAVACMAHIESVLPYGLRTLVRPGPIDGETWTLLVENTAATSKLRQLLPTLEAALRVQEPGLQSIRLKVSPRQDQPG